MANQLFFNLSYWFGFTPWNTGVTPPELIRFLECHPPGRVIDLGCGTGTNVIAMAERGWQAEGVDYAPRAIRIARRKASRSSASRRIHFSRGSVLSERNYQGEYDLILDIGCFHNFSGSQVDLYLGLVQKHLAPGGGLLLYAHLRTDPDQGHGASEESLARMGELFKLVERQGGREGARPSAWLEFKKQ